jgi:uncharacterized protein (TIGR03435 family)
MTSRSALFTFFILSGALGMAISAPISHPEFEAASIKPSGACDGGGAPQPGRLRLRCITVAALIQMAHGYFANGVSYTPKLLRISGTPTWANSDRYDIEATAQGNPSQALMRGPMLQALLEDRFGLSFHRETKEGAVYALSVAKGGVRMPRTEEDSCTPSCGTETRKRNGQTLTVSVHGISLAGLSDGLLTELAGRPVIDKTGVSGLFDLHLEFTPDDKDSSGTDGAAAPSIFTALQEQLGLRLEPARGPVELFVIDHVERPGEN